MILGERAWEPVGLLPRLYDADRILVTASESAGWNPLAGALLPRVFPRVLLCAAAERIPRPLWNSITYPDHAIISYEVSKHTRNVAFIPDALWHYENASLVELFRKHFRYGRDAARLAYHEEYGNLVRRREKGRGGPPPGLWSQWVQAELLMSLKGSAYALGYLLSSQSGIPLS